MCTYVPQHALVVAPHLEPAAPAGDGIRTSSSAAPHAGEYGGDGATYVGGWDAYGYVYKYMVLFA